MEVWVDFEHCNSEDLWEEIAVAIEGANVILFLLSPAYEDSRSCRQEVKYTVDRLNKRFIPVFVNKDFRPPSWLDIRIAGRQYIRFEKKPFDTCGNELMQLILDNPLGEKSDQNKSNQPLVGSSTSEKKPIENTNKSEVKSTDDNNHFQADQNSSSKSVEKWTRRDVAQWFRDNHIHQELADLYDFQSGVDILVYAQCLQPTWEDEYKALNEQYEEK